VHCERSISQVPHNEPANTASSTCASLPLTNIIAGCEACSEDAEIPFDNILDRLTGSDPSVTDYVLEGPVRCLQCGAEINEKTLVDLV